MEIQSIPLEHRTFAGKVRPWRVRKLQALALADAYRHLGEEKRAARVAACANRLQFSVFKRDGATYRKLVRTELCRDRLCPLCQGQRSRKLYFRLAEVYEQYRLANRSSQAALLTLTIPNVNGAGLPEAVSELLLGFRRLWRRKKFKNANKAWFRALEVTVNREQKTFHPHIHVVVMLHPHYFKTDRDIYMTTDEWRRIWRSCMRRYDIKVVDIRRIRPRKVSRKRYARTRDVLIEVTKYATKPDDLFRWNGDKFVCDPAAIAALHKALSGRRLVSLGGLFRKISRSISAGDLEADDDLLEQDTDIPSDANEITLETYYWTTCRPRNHADYLLGDRDARPA